MWTPVALRGYSFIIAQPFQGKTETLSVTTPTILGASNFSTSYRSIDSINSVSAFEHSGASFGRHTRYPGRPSLELRASLPKNNLKLSSKVEFRTRPVRQRIVEFSSRGILTRSSCIGSKFGRHRINMGAAHSRSQAPNSLEISVNPDSFNKDLLSKIEILKEPYKRPVFLRNRHVETIFASFYRSLPKLTYERELPKMADGGTVALDWPIGGEDEDVWRGQLEQDVPVLILLPGLTGGSGDTYVRHMLIRARRAGWRVVVFNSRGCGDSPVTTPQFYSASFTEDLRQVVKHVGSLYPNSKVYAVGWSLGANILVRYIGQEGDNCPLAGAVSLCNPFDLVLANTEFHKGFNNVYNQNLASALTKIFAKHASVFEGIGGEFNVPLAANAKTVRDFDEGITRVSFGFKTVDEYYFYSSSSRNIKDVKIPLLCIQAQDDPIAPSAGIPRADIQSNLNCALVVSPAGGHLGWIAGQGGIFGPPWTDPLVMDYLRLLNKSVESRTAFATSRGQAGDVQLVGVETRETSLEESTIAEPIVR
ncbi:unnamed protein product [Calypogeia fissa]